MLDDHDLEARLRDSLSRAAPQGLPTIGVRERIVGAVRSRRARRHRIAGGVAAACLVVGGLSAGVVALHQPGNAGRSDFDAAGQAGSAGHAPASPAANPEHPAGTTTSIPGPRADCGEVAVGQSVVPGCYGVFATSSGSVQSGAVGFAAPTFTTNSAGSDTTSGGLDKSRQYRQYGGYQVVVPVGRPVTLVLPGSAAEIWTAPAVVAGQGTDAARVRTISARFGAVGQGSSATFESTVAVTVAIDASALGVCGGHHTPCGMPTGLWSVVLEFQAS